MIGVLIGQRLRRDRWQLALWILGTAALAAAAVGGTLQEYGTEADRRGVLSLAVAARTVLIFRGTPNGPEEGPFAFFLIFAWLALMGGLMTTFLAVRHTRAEEELGRSELIAATPAARILPTAATALHGALANAALGLAVAAAFMLSGLDAAGSLVAGAALSATGIAFLGLGLAFAQLFRTARAANSAGVVVVLGAYLLRGVGDAAGTPSADLVHVRPAWPSWLSPIGYGQLTGAFAEDRLLPLLVPVAGGVVLSALAVGLQSLRDEGDSLLPARAGRDRAGAVLSGSFGLAWRLCVPILASWTAGGVVTGLLATSLTGLLGRIGEQAPQVVETLRVAAGGAASIEQAFVATFYGVVGVLASCCAVQVGVRARQEEVLGTAEAVLATPVSRVRWLLGYGAVGVLVIAVVLAASGLAGAAGALSGGSSGLEVSDVARAALAQAPACLVFLGLTLLLFAVLPRLTVPLAWAMVGVAAVLGIFAPLFGAPGWLTDLSPFAHTPVPAGAETDWSGGLWLLAVGVVLSVGAAVGMRRREILGGG